MKNFIYLSLIALVLLSSCKSNSFMTQRYTKLGHSSHKRSQPEVAKAERKHSEIKGTDVAEPLDKSYKTEETTAFAMNALQPDIRNVEQNHSAGFSPKRIVDPLLRLGNKGVALVKEELQKSEAQKITSKKTFKDKVSRAAGLLNTALKIVLFAVVLAILVAVIIIIILT